MKTYFWDGNGLNPFPFKLLIMCNKLFKEKLYIPIFPELAEFLITESSIEVVFVDNYSSEKKIIVLDSLNSKDVIERVRLAQDKRKIDGGLFMRHTIPDLVFKGSVKYGIQYHEIYNNYNYLNWELEDNGM